MKTLLLILFVFLFVVKLSNAQCTVATCDDNPDYERQCLQATCSRAGICVTSPINCPDDPPCLEGVCVVGTGCQLQVRNCSNAKFCDYDFKCNATTSGCQHRTLPGCIECKFIGCTTTDQCNKQVCSDDGRSCVTQPKDCNDNNACTNDVCQSPDGVCQHPMIPGCVNCPSAGIGCITTDRCFPQLCPTDGSQNCINSTKNCDDSNFCTIDTCDNGTCIHTEIENCVNCAFIGCITIDQCNEQVCSADGRSCENRLKVCSSDDLCSVGSCLSPNGDCSFIPKDCDDNDPCTIDSCLAGVCSHVAIQQCGECQAIGCITTDQCFPKTCIDGTDCTNTTKSCDDLNFCTDDSCVSPTGACLSTMVPNCVSCGINVGCITTNKCFPQICGTGEGTECQNTTKNCDDGNGCTTDLCDPDTGNCYHVMIPGCLNCNGIGCINDDRCFPKTCVGAQCGNTTKSCEDGNGCSINQCSSPGGMCSNVPIPDCVSCNGTPCITTNPCEPMVCSADGRSCVATTKDCDDGDFCTVNSCNPDDGTCSNFRIPNCISCRSIGCTTTDQCFPKICSPTGDSCLTIQKSCDDGLPCTIDSCISPNGTCVHTQSRSAQCNNCQQFGCMNSTDPCKQNVCTPYGCQLIPINCDDHDTCTRDTCSDGVCRHEHIPGCCHDTPSLGGHFTESGTGNPGLCLGRKCQKGFECQVINNRAECIPIKHQCLDCRDLYCEKDCSLTCIMIKNPGFNREKHRGKGCVGEGCCEFTPTCVTKINLTK